MKRSQYLYPLVLAVLITHSGFADDVTFSGQVRPLLQKYCQRCHGPEEANSKIRVDVLDGGFRGGHLFTWDKILHVLATDDEDLRMPPADELQPEAGERSLLTQWITEELKQARKRDAVNNGYSRRLTKLQYQNTLRDLLLLRDNFAEVLPNDAVTRDGYHSMEVMQVSPIHLEYYFEIADKALSAAIVDVNQPPQIHNFRVNLGAGINTDDFEDKLILGANSRLLPVADFTVDELNPGKDFPFTLHKFQREFSYIEGYIGNGTIREEREFQGIYHNVFACLRGQGGYPKGNAETMISQGLLLRPSIPNTELFRMGSTYGPSPNFKIALRELPLYGNFRVKVEASKYDDVLILDRGHPPFDHEKGRSIVLDAEGKTRLQTELVDDGVYQIDVTYSSKPQEATLVLAFDGKEYDLRARETRSNKIDVINVPGNGKLVDTVTIENPQKGKSTLNLAEVEILSDGENVAKQATLSFSSEHYRNVAAHVVDGDTSNLFQTESENKPWIKFVFEKPIFVDSVRITNSRDGKLKDQILGVNVLLSHGKEEVHRHVVAPTYASVTKSFCLLERQAGPVVIEWNSPGGTTVEQVILSKLNEDDALVETFERFKNRNPQLGVYLGFRRDCGSALSPVGRAVPVSSTTPQFYSFEDAITNYPISVMEKGNRNYLAGISEIGVRNEYLDGRDAPRLLVRSIEFEGPYFESWPPESHKHIFMESPHRSEPEMYAAEIIRHFMAKAYRRPVTDDEFARIFHVWERAFAENRNFEASIKDALVVVLCSPQFLLITDASTSEQSEEVTDYELASKLSYFLWNSSPDEELYNLAKAGTLRKSLNGQIDRMLADPRSESFVETFAFQWLNLDKVTTVETNMEKYPQLTKYAKRHLQEEPVKFLGYLIRNNLKLANIIDSDFTLADDVVAGYYGIEGTDNGLVFAKVELPENRGGILAQAGILAGLSDGSESNPVKRGNWVARKIVSEPPGEPPPNVPNIDEVKGDFTLREKLEMHRSQEGCVKCHTKIDPWGIPFEQFDAGGKFKPDADSVSELPDGRTVRNLEELQQYLLTDKMNQVAFGFMQHLSTYALGRSLTFQELDELKSQAKTLKTDGYRIKNIIKSLVHSEMFSRK